MVTMVGPFGSGPERVTALDCGASDRIYFASGLLCVRLTGCAGFLQQFGGVFFPEF